MEDSEESHTPSSTIFSKLPIWAVCLVLLGSFGMFYGFYLLHQVSSQSTLQVIDASEDTQLDSSSSSKVTSQITVDISGAVQKPGLYKLPENSRIDDAIRVAGGWASSADGEYISQKINLSEVLHDQAKIYIPVKNELNQQSSVLGMQNSSDKISINSASSIQLQSLEGIGEARAEKIIQNRPYQSLNDLLEKEVLSKNLFEKIQKDISL